MRLLPYYNLLLKMLSLLLRVVEEPLQVLLKRFLKEKDNKLTLAKDKKWQTFKLIPLQKVSEITELFTVLI